MTFETIILYTIVGLSLTNLVRMAVYLVSSDLYAISLARRKAANPEPYLPEVTVLIPAYNEEQTIQHSAQSVIFSSYPAEKLKLIIVSDGSKDNTVSISHQLIDALQTLQKIGRCHRLPSVELIDRPNQGKASALNYALQHHVTSPLVMCLDADSSLSPDAIFNATQHFRDEHIVALSSNVNIVEDGTLLALAQRLEYIVCYQMKRGQSLLDIEYIVGGIGSMFRMDTLRSVEFYDTNTMTEDIDLTMKILVHKTRSQRIGYAYDSVVYTEPAHSLKELMTQRYRWKFGRSQTFIKHLSLFFSRQPNHRKRLSWFTLPYSLLQDLMFFIEPLIIVWFFYLVIAFGDTTTIVTALIVITLYTCANVIASSHLSLREQLRLIYFAPPMYFVMYVLSWAEYYALVKAFLRSHTLRGSIRNQHTTWVSPTRHGGKTTTG